MDRSAAADSGNSYALAQSRILTAVAPSRCMTCWRSIIFYSLRIVRPRGRVIFMSQNRREFIKSSTAVTLLTVSSASAAPATRNVAILHSTRVSDQDLRCFQARLGSSNT